MTEGSDGNKPRQLRLISVTFKEASLDSPSFRASVNFFQTRVELFEDWIEKTTDFYDHKYKASFEDFQRAKETLLSQLLPSPVMVSNGFVANQTLTPLLIDSFNKDYMEFSTRIMKIVLGDDISHSANLLELMTIAIEPYRNKRKNFEYYQGKFDSTLATYQSVNVTASNVDPQTIRNDVMQLFEIHKSYLQASLDLISAISLMQLELDRFLMESMSLLKEKSLFTFKESGKVIDLVPSLNEHLDDYSLWVQNSIAGAKALDSDIQHARKQIFEYTLKQITPSNNIEDYNVKSIRSANIINAAKLKTPTSSPDKAGWLFMKTQVGKPGRTIWVRRWCFLSNSVFGLFLLSPSKTYVEETDKFGVLLTNVRYAPDEERKFCFEVRILRNKAIESNGHPAKDISLVFQSDSLSELKSWLTVFESAKKYALSLDSKFFQHEMAFKRFSPKFYEFASSTTTSIDQQITTFDQNSTSLTESLDYSFSEYEILSLTNMKLFKFQMVMTPICTKMTQLAILSNHFTKGSWFPNAILANVWGVTNWSEYSVFHDTNKSNPPLILHKSQKALNAMTSTVYPSYYPNDLKITDLQFKNLFFSIDQKLAAQVNEFVLYKFDTFWNPNKRQRFFSTCFITNEHLYYYMNSMGFICLNRLKLGDIVSVEADKSSKNLIKMFDIHGIQIRSYILFTDRRVVVTKIQYLLENNASESPAGIETILKRFAKIDKELQETKLLERIAQEKGNSTPNNESMASNLNKTALETSFWNIDAPTNELITRLKNIEKEFTVTYKHDYDIPAKGLMHILFGDRSEAFPRCLFLADKTSKKNLCWGWKQEKIDENTTQLARTIQFELNKTDSFISDKKFHRNGETEVLKVKQRVVKMLENRYYEIDLDPIIIKVPFCHLLKVTSKYIITETHNTENLKTTNIDSVSYTHLDVYKRQLLGNLYEVM